MQQGPKPDSNKSLSGNGATPGAVASIFQFFKDALFTGGVFLVLMAGGLIVTFTGELMVGDTRGHSVGSQLGLIVFLCGIFFVGCKMIMSKLNERKAIKELKEEQLLLNRAKAEKGVLTVSEAALECQMSILDTKKAFERLALTSVCRIDVTEEGELCYRFPSFESEVIVQKGPTALDPELQIVETSQVIDTSVKQRMPE